MAYTPTPVDTSDVVLPQELKNLVEQLAENVHENWAHKRIAENWSYGEYKDDLRRKTPCLVPYTELPEIEKSYDRQTAMETIKVLLKLGYRIEKVED